ncbi:tRNA pseudouridine(38-40) synthase TruA [Candidatus Formimonas warabiya]|uniref:tRNA pseudouridine synthase A n=1 Tax=Formimonas warabiya TaxID=1761012 RepID=A0A3G1KXD7_FORW1|nr:tRNA pseudouridine(38-40) synthase TruA [Candidatus Formimonas warabiya]ATW27144.1 tRNA pseudouridine(38-40) synthase TruA [Candidatus Formimonas warabiya]
MTRNIKLLIEYEGTNYVGWQKQPESHGKSIQGLLEDSLRTMVQHEVHLTAAGRTDAGVHAQGQVANFFTPSAIPAERFPPGLKGLLPADIVVKGAWEVPEQFHARYSALRKTYRYTIRTARAPSAFEWRYSLHLPIPLNVEAMKTGAGFFLGTHDFTSFCAKGSPAKKFIRTVHACRISSDQEHIYFEVTADGFLYNMVRIMVGTLVNVGRGRWAPEHVKTIIEAKNRNLAGPTAEPQGLMLCEVNY